MGYSYENGGQIKNFWPDDDENTIYLTDVVNLMDIYERITDKWGGDVTFANVTFEAERIHTSCLTYDLYDPSDYTNFIVVKRVK